MSISATITTCFGEDTNGVSLFYPGLDRHNKVITARHISKCTEFGTISELPLNRKETGNTLETRGLTYSYTFLTKPKRSTYGRFVSAKNAHLGCKDTKTNSFLPNGVIYFFQVYCDIHFYRDTNYSVRSLQRTESCLPFHIHICS